MNGRVNAVHNTGRRSLPSFSGSSSYRVFVTSFAVLVALLLIYSVAYTSSSHSATPRLLNAHAVKIAADAVSSSLTVKLRQARLGTSNATVLGASDSDSDVYDPSAPSCSWHFVRYEPSKYESLWRKNVAQWGASTDAYCKAVQAQEAEIATWLTAVNSKMNASDAAVQSSASALLSSAPKPASDPIISRFLFEERCENGATRGYRYSFIEPLAAGLRHPRAVCFGARNVGNKKYLLPAARDDPAARDALRPQPTPADPSHTRGQAVLLDLGASTYRTGAGGASQSYFIETYKRRGIDFHRVLLWEAKPREAQKLFGEVAEDVLHAYQYFNIPAVPTPRDARNPLEILRRIATPEDFVVLKLDIDTYPVEMAFIEQILSDDGLASLVDELFFEHHVTFEPLMPDWKKTAQPDASLEDSYEIFTRLRHMGIRAHGW